MFLPSRFSNGNNLLDLLNRDNHSRDFCAVRDELLRARLRIVALLFSALAAVWIVVDWLLLPWDTFTVSAPMMLVLSAAFLAIHIMASREDAPPASVLLNSFFGLVLGYYLVSRHVLPDISEQEALIVGHTFAPFMLVTVMALFPMTIVEALWHQTAIFIVYMGSRLCDGGFADVATIGEAWLLGSMALFLAGAQFSQLHMLLRLYREASYDVLTGLVNRRVAGKSLEREIAQAHELQTPLSVLLFDLDHFKRINDLHGHLVGDDVLRAFGALLSEKISNPHTVARFGGEEFLAVLHDCDRECARKIAEQVRLACHDINVTGEGGAVLKVSVSIGVAQYRDGEAALELLARVDDVLYDAKESGRDFVAVSPS
ncbi:MAG: diguanylate cyclase [Gammaproteobacteria bacterium]